ncbi:GntR family transcriptional regulator [Paenibacillus sp. NPDC056579]|uniref:GntR family transcriptional regulator n=1 Tax=Paenibacillus sp. NPDC056579 TaxID=3345871 RepID=UPI0036A918E1
MLNRYSDICNMLLKDVDQGLYQEGERLPTEKELCLRFGVSRETIRKALRHLIESAVYTVFKGRGTMCGVKGCI